MTQRSKKHHQVPKWILKNFCIKGSDRLWVGFCASGKVMRQRVDEVFYRKNANTRTDYIPDGKGEFRPVKSDQDEQILADFDGRTSMAAKRLLQWARQYRKTGEAPPHPPQDDVVNLCKTLIVTQARRTHESQDRINLTEGYEDIWWDSVYKRAEDVGFELVPREELTREPRMQALVSNMIQNERANFASGNHSILKKKENDYLGTIGLGVGVIVGSDSGLVIGSQGITTLKESSGEQTYLPLAPDVVVYPTSNPEYCTLATFRDSFVKQHNKAASMMSRSIAGNSKQAIAGC